MFNNITICSIALFLHTVGALGIFAALAGVLALGVIGGVLTGRRMRPAAQAAARQSGRLSDELRQQLNDPLLWASLRVRTAIGLGIVFQMSAKPGPAGSLVAMLVAILLGLAFSLPARERERKEAPAWQGIDGT